MTHEALPVICFEVYRNGKKLCTAGVGDYGVLSTIVTRAAISPQAHRRRHPRIAPTPPDLYLHVGGAPERTPAEPFEHWIWKTRKLAVGDDIRIRVVESAVADKPRKRKEHRVP